MFINTKRNDLDQLFARTTNSIRKHIKFNCVYLQSLLLLNKLHMQFAIY